MRALWSRLGPPLWTALMAAAVVYGASRLEWSEVGRALLAYEWTTLSLVLLIVVPGYLACASYDLVGRSCTGHGLPLGRTMAISFVGYCFSLNLGALLGGLAFRYRLYARSGLAPWTIGQVIALSVLTNWLGYVLMAGLLLSFAPPGLAPLGGASPALLRGIGIALLIAAALYLALCLRRGGDELRWRERTLVLPDLRVAAVQLGLSSLSWCVIGAAIAWLLPAGVSWLSVMPVLLTAAIAGVISHVPGGLGVFEFVFVAMLGAEVERSALIGALLAFRASYYLVPFAAAAALYAALELSAEGTSEDARGCC